MGAPERGSEDHTVAVQSAFDEVVSAPEQRWSPSRERYLVIEEVGRGRTGVVERAYDTRLQREVALRSVELPSHDETLSKQIESQITDGARAMAKLSHPNVVAIYDVASSGTEVIIAAEYVRGMMLAKWLEKRPPWQAIVRHFISAGRGLAAAHSASLAHGSFDARNVLLGDDDRARVTDFGLRHAQDAVASGFIHRGDAPSPRGDQFDFCVALFEGLTDTPFVGRDEQSAGSEQPPMWPRHITVPTAVREAVNRGLARDPGQRWSDLESLLERLAASSEPKQHRGQWLIAASMVATLGASGSAWALNQRQQAARCTGAPEQLREVWDEQRRDRLHQAMHATGISYARDVAAHISPQLDAYATAWTAMHTDACEATTVRGEQPATVMDLRMGCLNRARVELHAATNLLSNPDADVVAQAHAVVAALPDLSRCADVEALQADVAPPDASERDAVEAIRAELAVAKAEREAGKYSDALTRVQPLQQQALRLRHVPIQTEVNMELGLLWRHADQYAQAESLLKHALRSALGSRQWDEARRIATRLMFSLESRPIEALAYAEMAKSLLGGGGPGVEAELRSHIGIALEVLGRAPEAEVEHRTALRLAEEFWGPSHMLTAHYRNSLAINLRYQQRLTEAEHEVRKVLAALQDAVGTEHPTVATAHHELAELFLVRGDYSAAESEYRVALAARESALGVDHTQTIGTRVSLARVLAEQDRVVAAEAEYRAALSSELRIFGNDHPTPAITRGNLGLLLSNSLRYAEAEHEMRITVETLARALGPDHPIMASARHNLAVALHGLRRYDEAAAELETGVAVALRKENNPRVLAHLRSSLGKTLAARGQLEAAEDQLRQALTLQAAAYEDEHPHTAIFRTSLGKVLQSQHRYGEAEAEYHESLAILQRRTPDNHHELAERYRLLGLCMLESGRAPEARDTFEEAWSAWGQDTDVGLTIRAELAFGLARALWTTGGDRARAQGLAREAHELFATVAPGTHDEERREVEAWLAAHG